MIEAIVDGVAVGMAVGPMLWLLLEGGAWIVKTIRKESTNWFRPNHSTKNRLATSLFRSE